MDRRELLKFFGIGTIITPVLDGKPRSLLTEDEFVSRADAEREGTTNANEDPALPQDSLLCKAAEQKGGE